MLPYARLKELPTKCNVIGTLTREKMWEYNATSFLGTCCLQNKRCSKFFFFEQRSFTAEKHYI